MAAGGTNPLLPPGTQAPCALQLRLHGAHIAQLLALTAPALVCRLHLRHFVCPQQRVLYVSYRRGVGIPPEPVLQLQCECPGLCERRVRSAGSAMLPCMPTAHRPHALTQQTR